MARELRDGDEVEWNTPQGVTHGRVVRKLTRRTHVEGTEIAATPDDPRWLVESAKSGKRAAHTADALRRR